ncbi:unnamed protein product [Darwinula stevensoni]|uniref:Large ribosomal subunit protein uL10 n=1 Tax=Darwinula stevensoni TaxID=69355 RepID=A0A7R8XEM3_9CRUS|nr:unnamed protein product [Darwinula stevensoni]CAG0894362.1 unnamed protein product [Darwinula stevensoni]
MRQKFDLDRDHLRTCLLYEFRLGEKAADAHRRLCQAFGEGAISEKTCFDRFARFKSGNYSVEDKPRSGRPSELDDEALLQLVEADPSMTTRDMAAGNPCSTHKMGREDKTAWKANYFLKLVQLLDEYPRCFVVGVDNVTSKQMQQIRSSLRSQAVILMGKNTMMRKAIRGHLENNPMLEKLLPHIKGNVGFVFTKEDLVEIRDLILDNKVKAPARAGAIAPCDVTVPAQNTGLGPEKTSFFQAFWVLGVPKALWAHPLLFTFKLTICSSAHFLIQNSVKLIKEGEKVGASEATLLNMLNISPFTYGLVVQQVYDSGTVFSPEILDITNDDLRAKFFDGVRNIAAVCLQIGYPTVASVPHSVIHGFKNLLAIAAMTDIVFKEAETVKEYLKIFKVNSLKI